MIIAIVGSPLSGKTTLLKELQKAGVPVFHTDSYITEIYKVNGEGYNIIKEQLGDNFVDEEKVNRREIAAWLAEDEQNILKLNELIHPIVYKHLEGKDNYVAEIPIISNSQIKFNYDKIILVTASEETLVSRFNNSTLRNPQLILKLISDWKDEDNYDLVINTDNNITKSEIDNIITLLNEG